jgi:hypothetical protein
VKPTAIRVDRCPRCAATLRERTTQKNARFHAVMGELSAQLDWPRGSGDHIGIEAWKRLMVAAFERAHGRPAELYPAIDGQGFDVVYQRTSRMAQEEMRELIDFAESWALEQGVELKELREMASA